MENYNTFAETEALLKCTEDGSLGLFLFQCYYICIPDKSQYLKSR